MSLEDQVAELTRVVETGLSSIADLLQQLISQPQTATVPAPTETAKPNGQDQPTEVVEPPGPTFDQVTAIAQEIARRKGPPAAIGLIMQHGAKKLAEMDKSKYPAFVAAAEVLLAGDDPAL